MSGRVLVADKPVIFGPTPQAKLVAMGDSMTADDGGHNPTDDCYRAFLYNSLYNTGLNFTYVGSQDSGSPTDLPPGQTVHEGYDGNRTDQLLAKVPTIMSTYNPDGVFLLIGENDCSQGVPASTSVGHVGDIIDACIAGNPEVWVFVSEVPPTNNPPDGFGFTPEQYFNQALGPMIAARVALGQQVRLCPVWADFVYPTDVVDGVHPAPSGNAKIANRFFEAIYSIL